MATRQLNDVVQYLRNTVLTIHDERTDGELLGAFLHNQDAAALDALVRRHGPMVWGVCHRVLSHQHDAEDAFQTTFLVLVRRAATIRRQERVANWLYGVAHQTALKARALAVRRGARERQVTDMPEPSVAGPDLYNDVQPVLDRELSRLPEPYRVILVLCDLEGKTRKEAARQLGWPEGTVAGRLARARSQLARELTRHGLAVSGGTLAANLSQGAAAANLPTSVMTSTIKIATRFAAEATALPGLISGEVAALTKGVLKTMLLFKLKVVAGVVLALAVIALGGGLSYHTPATAEAAGPKLAALAPPAPRGQEKTNPAKDDETLKHTLLILEKARWDAGVRQDADALDKLLTEEWVGFSMNHRYTRADYLGSLKRQRVAPGYKIHDVELIRLNEKAAILSYKAEWKLLTSDGDLLAKRNRRGCVSWVQRGGGWVVACVQDMVIGEE